MDMSEGRAGLPVAVFSPHPLQPSRDRQILHAVLEPGETLGQYFERTGIADLIRHRPTLVSIDGMRVPREMWRHCRPKPGTLIQVQALIHGGGGGGKNPIAMVLSIALMVVAPYLAPVLAGAMGVAGPIGMMAIRIGISVVGGMAINALFPPPKPKTAQAALGNVGQDSPTYSLSGGSNRMRPYAPMPVFMGTHRIFPDAGAKPYTEFEGEDQYLYQVFEFGYNDLDLSNYKIGANAIETYAGVTIQESGADGKLTLFHVNVDSQEGGTLVLGGAYIQKTSSPGSVALAVDVTGFVFGIEQKTGEIVASTSYIEVDYRAVGAGAWLPFWEGSAGGANVIIIPNATRKPLRRTYKIAVAEGQYEVRTRFTIATEAPGYTNDLTFSQLQSYQSDTADYTGRKRVGLKIKASGQLNGAVEQFSAIGRAKTLVWNGAAWVLAQTSNPAWWVLAATRGKFVGSRRVWGGGITEARIGLENIKAFGVWCDLKGLTFNGVFDQQLSVYDMLSAIALRGRGTISRASGMTEVVWDAPDQPAVAVFGMSNIKLDTFEIEYVSEQLADEIVLSFINPDLDWQTDVVRALAPGVTDPVRSRNMDLFGCTNKEEAGRDANLYIATNIHRTKKYRWQMDWEGMPVSRGEVGYLSHDLASFDYSGRLIEGTTAGQLKLERAVPLNTAGSFITIVKPDGTFATYAVQGGFGDSSTIDLVAPLGFDPGADPDHPPYDYRWLYGHTATPGKKVKIEAFAVKGYDTVELTAIDETSDYYDSEDNPYIHVPVLPIFGNAPTISNLQITEEGVRAGQGYLARVIVTWDAGPGFSFADVRTSIAGGPMELRGQNIRANSFDFLCTDQVDVTVDVIGYGRMERLGKSTVVSKTQHIDFAAVARPSDVVGFMLQGRSFSWTPGEEIDVIGARIRFHYNLRQSWDDANELHSGLLVGSPATFPELPPNQMTYGIKWVDAAELESVHALWITVDAREFSPEGDPLVANVVEIIDFEAMGWPGIVTNGSEVGGALEADSDASFYSESGIEPMYGAADGDSFYKAANFNEMTYETDEFTVTAALVGSRMTLEHAIAGEPLYVEYRKITQIPFYGDDADPFYGADADPFYEQSIAGGYVAWPGAIVTENEAYQIRVITGQSDTPGIISALAAIIDAPDIVETFDDISIDAGGTRLAIARDYEVIKNVQVTLQHDAGTAITVTIEDKDPDLGPLIMARNSSQVAVAALVDASIQGY